MPLPKVSPFEKWTRADAEKAIRVVDEYAANEEFVKGNHWQSGAGWVGPRPRTTDEGFAETMGEIEKSFTSRNTIAEVVERHVRGVVGREPMWSLALREPLEEGVELPDADVKAIAEAEAILTEWWDGRQIMRTLQNWVAIMLWAERSVLRIFVPPGLLEEAEGEGAGAGALQFPEVEDVAAGLELIFPDIPLPKTATVYTDPDTRERVGVFISEQGGKTVVELTFRAGQEAPEIEGAPAAETPEPGDVVLRMLGQAEPVPRFSFPLGGNLWMFQGERPLLVTRQVQQGQRALNLALSMLPRNIVTGGFLERVLLNAQMPGKWERNEAGEPTKFVPDPYVTGPGTTNFVVGVSTEDDDGAQKIASPSVQWRDPVDVQPAIDAKDAHYGDILDETDQAHVLMNAEADASGRSREQARSDYVASLTRTRAEVESAVRWLLETVLRLAEIFAGKPGLYTEKYRIHVMCQLDVGPISPEERKQNVEEANAGHMSQATAMARNGIADPDAELDAIAGQENHGLAVMKQRAEVIEILTRAGAGLKQAALAVGMDEEDANTLASGADEPDDGEEGGGGAPPSGGFIQQ